MTTQLTEDGPITVQVLFSFVQATKDELPALFVCTAEYLEYNEETDDDITPEQFPDIFEACEPEDEDDCIFYVVKGSTRFRFYDMGYGTWGIEELKDGEYDCVGEVDEKALMMLLGQAGLVKDDSLIQYF